MKKIVIIMMVVMMVVSVHAGWFSKAKEDVKELVDSKENKPINGYFETVELTTNDWDVCLMLCHLDIKNVTCSPLYFTSRYSCVMDHINNYPKTSTATLGVQEKTTKKKYKDGRLVGETVEYEYPHKKIEKTTVVSIQYSTNTTEVITEVAKAKE